MYRVALLLDIARHTSLLKQLRPVSHTRTENFFRAVETRKPMDWRRSLPPFRVLTGAWGDDRVVEHFRRACVFRSVEVQAIRV